MTEIDDNPRKKRPLDSVLLEQYIAMVRVFGGLLTTARTTLLHVAKEKGVSLEALGVSKETFVDLGEEIPTLVHTHVKAPEGAVVHRSTMPAPASSPRNGASAGLMLSADCLANPEGTRRALERRPKRTASIDLDDDNPHPELSRAEYRILLAAAQRPGSNAKQLAKLAGYRMSGGVMGALASLRRSGFLDGCEATKEGLRVLGPYEKLPTGKALRDYWTEWLKKKVGLCAARLFALACDRHPVALDPREAAEILGYEMSGGVMGALAAMRKLDLVAKRGKMAVNPMLFEESKRRKGKAA